MMDLLRQPLHRIALVVVAGVAMWPAAADDLACLDHGGGEVHGDRRWYAELLTAANAGLDRRDERYEAIKTPEQIQAYQRSLRETLLRHLGGFPDRCPLDAAVVGRIPGSGYRIEKVIFASQPRHRVTANLYLPDGPGPFPVALVASGHSIQGKAADYNQRYAIDLVRHGIAAFAYDPLGQGERCQVLTAEGKPQHTDPVVEHFMAATGSILVGRNVATAMVWDSMRAIDYLATRADIDATRVGITGCSGGGNITSYVSSLDDRIACAAPACWLTTLRRLLGTIGPQDAEQNVFGQIAIGLDQPDYVLMAAPRPLLISTTTGDFFDIRGSWENFRQAKRIYARLGCSERIDLVEAEGEHGVPPGNLAATTQWMRRWLMGRDEPAAVADFSTFPLLPPDELACTERGQVLLIDGERSIYDLNAELAARLAAARAGRRRSAEELRTDIRRLAGIGQAGQPAELAVAGHPAELLAESVGRVARDGYEIEKLVLRGGSPTPLSALVCKPRKASGRTVLYLHDGGKTADAAPAGPIEKLVNDGCRVIAVDLRGQGETSRIARPDPRLDGLGDYKTFFLAYILGRSLVGCQADDILALGRWAAAGSEESPRDVHIVAVGRVGIAALHAAAVEPGRFKTLTLRGTPRRWMDVVGSPAGAAAMTATVHGALAAYDLDDLVAILPEGSVRFEPQPTAAP